MKRALSLAQKGRGFVSPNPCVGAVIVKNGLVVAEGYHKKAGGKHAEVLAVESYLRKSGSKNCKGLDIYVSLEPCCHHGKTPPCADLLIEMGFKHVFVGMRDPFPKVDGMGIEKLKRAGVVVEELGSESEIYRMLCGINQPFLKSVEKKMPYVILKVGMSLDGKMATASGESKWITSEASRLDARLERSICDAVLVGAGTIKADDPELAAHGKFAKKALLRVVIDGDLALSPKMKVFRDDNVFVACTQKASKKNRINFEKAGVRFADFGVDKVDMKLLLKYLQKEFAVQSVFVEGGAGIHGAFNDAGLIDRLLFYIAPKLIGGKDALAVVGGRGIAKLSSAKAMEDYEISILDGDIKVSGELRVY